MGLERTPSKLNCDDKTIEESDPVYVGNSKNDLMAGKFDTIVEDGIVMGTPRLSLAEEVVGSGTPGGKRIRDILTPTPPPRNVFLTPNNSREKNMIKRRRVGMNEEEGKQQEKTTSMVERDMENNDGIDSVGVDIVETSVDLTQSQILEKTKDQDMYICKLCKERAEDGTLECEGCAMCRLGTCQMCRPESERDDNDR